MTTTPHVENRPDTSDLLHIPATDVPERVHDNMHLLLWQVRGTSDFSLGSPRGEHRSTLSLSAGHALWLPSGYRHSVHVHNDATMLPTFYPVSSIATRLSAPVAVPVGAALQTLLLAQLQLQYTVVRPRASIARQILALIEDAPKIRDDLRTPVSTPARRIAEVIRFNPGDDRTAAELASSVHASLRTIQRQFSAETGLNIQQWRTRARLSAATELLRSGGGLAAVADRVGYADVSSFCRAFKVRYGVTTSEYLKRYASGVIGSP